jgi:rod shape-determining protein MreB
VIVGIPSGVTEVEKKAVHDAGISAGAKRVFLIEEPMAAAIGARMPIQDAGGNMIVDIGGGTSEMAVLSLGGIVIAKSLKVAGDRMNEDIIRYARSEHGLLLGERMAEEIKMKVGAAAPLNENLETEMRGRDLVTGLPKSVIVSDEDIRRALQKSTRTLISNIRTTVEETPPELVSDLMERGIVLAGGGSLIRGLDKAINDATDIPVKVAEDPLTTVVRGTGIVLEDLDKLEDVLIEDI